jgi:hypothetical protein
MSAVTSKDSSAETANRCTLLHALLVNADIAWDAAMLDTHHSLPYINWLLAKTTTAHQARHGGFVV